MKVRLPDRNDALVLIGGVGVVVGIWQALPWLAIVIGGAFLIYVGVATDRAGGDDGESD